MRSRSILKGLAVCSSFFVLTGYTAASAQTAQLRRAPDVPASSSPALGDTSTPATAAAELRTGTDLTRRGLLQEAIPHLIAAQQAGANAYAAGVNLGICYLGTGKYKQAIKDLEAMRNSGHRSTVVDNLLAQAYLGDGQTGLAFQVFQEAAATAPKDEKLYAYMADACTDHRDYSLGLRIMNLGLKQLPGSARLHYEKAVFLSRLDRFEEAKPEFGLAWKLAPGSYIGYLALVQKNLYEDNLAEANRLLHEAIKAGDRDYQTLSLLGSVLLAEGAAPGQPEFAEAQAALEESARERPDYPDTQIALGKLYLREGRYKDAAEHLEIGRRLDPGNRSVYSGLTSAYNRLGEREKARQMALHLGRLLAERKDSEPQP